MDARMQEQVRQLAYHIWASAGQEYGRAIDFWLMAEQMVSEITSVTSRIAQTAMGRRSEPGPATAEEFSQLYADRVRELAHAMWDAAEKQAEHTMDFWLSAEQHTRAIAEAAMRTAGSTVGVDKVVAQAFQAFSSEAYLDRIRRTAYFMWDAAGRQYGQSLEYWLAAERQVLHSIMATAPDADAVAPPETATAAISAPPRAERPKAPQPAQPTKPKSEPKPGETTAETLAVPPTDAAAPTKSEARKPSARAHGPAKARRTRTMTKKPATTEKKT